MRKRIENILFPLLLFLLPFWNVNQGLDFADTGYNLTNFANYGNLSTMWKLSTYLANETGALFMRLPGGDTLLGMNLYTSAVVGILAAAAYFFCRRLVPAVWTFLGEGLAVLLCWCPTVILYNYLTYLLMAMLLFCLYQGIQKESGLFLTAAGVILGIGVFVRFSNLAQMAFILLVWYSVWLRREKGKRLLPAARQTGWCLLGFLAGFGTLLITVCIRYGLTAYTDMLAGMQEVESGTSGYSVWDMLTAPFADYLFAVQWLVFWGLYIGAGRLLFHLSAGKWETFKKIVFLLGIPVLYKFAWGHSLLLQGQTMYDLNYYSYNAVYVPTAMLLLFSAGLCLYRLWDKRMGEKEKVTALLVLLVILVTPLGSNNKLHPIINNLFLVLPFTLAYTVQYGKKWHYTAKTVTAAFLLFFTIQTVCFGTLFVFEDGSYSEKRDTKIENNAILKGIYTTREKAETIEAIGAYYDSLEEGTSVMSYGNLPGLPYYLGADMAAANAWPDLASYSEQAYRQDLTNLDKRIKNGKARPMAVIADEFSSRKEDVKYKMLEQFLEEHEYERQLSIHGISVYY